MVSIVLCYYFIMKNTCFNIPGNYLENDGLIFKNQFHVVFCPKYKRPVLKEGIAKRLSYILYAEAQKMHVHILSLDIQPDHVHMFISFDPRLSLHKVIKQFKAVSSHILREEFPELVSKLPSLWTRSYLSSTDEVLDDILIKEYLNSQRGK